MFLNKKNPAYRGVSHNLLLAFLRTLPWFKVQLISATTRKLPANPLT
jgi:hypothetical protein